MASAVIAQRDLILARIANGDYSTRIAEELGLERSTISQALRNDPAYRQALETGHEVRLDKALQALEASETDLNLARAREAICRRIEWRAEREFPERWGAKGQVSVSTGSFEDVVAAVSSRMLQEKQVNAVATITQDGKDEES